jgi:hypothetical protein
MSALFLARTRDIAAHSRDGRRDCSNRADLRGQVLTHPIDLSYQPLIPRIDAVTEPTLTVRSFQTPSTSGTCACPPSLPFDPTSSETRLTSSARVRNDITCTSDQLSAARDIFMTDHSIDCCFEFCDFPSSFNVDSLAQIAFRNSLMDRQRAIDISHQCPNSLSSPWRYS